jgi:hypothetical protein
MDHASHIHIALPDEVTLIYRDKIGVKDYD